MDNKLYIDYLNSLHNYNAQNENAYGERNIFTRRRKSAGSTGQLQKLELDRTAHESTVEDLAGNETHSMNNQEYNIEIFIIARP